MTIDDRLVELWLTPPDERDDPVGTFLEVYADPVTINGSPMPVEGLVARARALHVAEVVSGLGIDLLTFTDGKITAIWVLADELQRILQVR